MKAKTLLISMFAITGIVAMAQRATMELTFTAVNNAVHVQMDSIKVMNRTQDCDTVLSWPDTVLAIEYIGLSENICQYDLFKVFQNHPNPALFETMVTLFMPEPGKVNLMVTDLSGRLVIKSEASLVKGYNLFNFLPGTSPVYIFTAQYNESIGTIKILNQLYRSGGNCSLKYMGSFSSGPALKTECLSGAFKLNQGDTLLLIGYSGSLQSGLLEIPITSQTYQFQFAYIIPCPDSPTITYEGQMYNTVQILSQCWLKENLNIGIMIPDNMESSDNGSIE